MSKQRKPRTIDEALRTWAMSMHDNKPATSHSTSSVYNDGDTIFHYGRHFPMAKMARDSRGKVRKVYITTTYWGGSGGFGYGTNGLVSGLKLILEIEAAGTKIEIVPLRLATGHSGPVKAVEDPKDPEPIIPDLNIPVCPSDGNQPYNPGPEPIKSDEGCLAGTVESVDDNTTNLYYGESQWRPYSGPVSDNLNLGDKYQQCPHCAAYQKDKSRWNMMTYGGKNYQTGESVRMGWKAYREQMEVFGFDLSVWRHARSSLYRLKKQREAEHAEWMERNAMPFDSVPTDAKGRVLIPRIDPETGRVSRRTIANYQKHCRALIRQSKIRREQQEYDRLQRILREQREMEERLERMAKLREEWEKNGVTPADSVDETTVAWLADHGLTPNPDGRTVTLVKRLDTTEDGLRPTTYGNPNFIYPEEGYVIAEDYRDNNACGHGLHWSANFKEATEVYYGDTMIEADVDLESMRVIKSNKVKSQWAVVKRIVPVEEWQAAQQEAAA